MIGGLEVGFVGWWIGPQMSTTQELPLVVTLQGLGQVVEELDERGRITFSGVFIQKSAEVACERGGRRLPLRGAAKGTTRTVVSFTAVHCQTEWHGIAESMGGGTGS
jgi:hypothetical protein